MAGSSEEKLRVGDDSVAFVVTGFGPFQRVQDNPTKAIVETLVEYLKQNPSTEKLAQNTSTIILETSADCARMQLDTLHDEWEKSMEAMASAEYSTKTSAHGRVVLIHIGVNYRGKQYELERYAYNDATFRIPDEKGYKPQKENIIIDEPLGKRLETKLNVQQLCEELQMETTTTPKISTDPGRFVCNYTYYYSMDKLQNSTCTDNDINGKNVYSLFLHVPKFEIAPKEEQMKFVADLMTKINKQICSS